MCRSGKGVSCKINVSVYRPENTCAMNNTRFNKAVFLSWHQSLPGLVREFYHRIPFEKHFIAKNHIKKPRLFDQDLMGQKTSYVYDEDEDILQKLEQLNPDFLLVWNGDFDDELRGCQPELIKKIQTMGIKVVFAEHGWLPQKGTFTLDNKGTNGGSEHIPKESLGEEICESSVMALLDHYRQFVVDVPVSDYVFIPLQISSDTQIVKYSPHFKDMKRFVRFVVKRFPKSKKVFKVHPKDPDRHKLVAFINKCGAKSIAVDDANPIAWGYHSKMILAINSTLVNELLVFNKKIITFGTNYFSNKGVTYEVGSDGVINHRLFQPDNRRSQQYLTGLYRLQIDARNPDVEKALSLINV